MDIMRQNRKKLDTKAAESRKNVEKWRWGQTGLTKIMGTKFIVSPRLFYRFHNNNKNIPNFSSKEREMNLAWHRKGFFLIGRSIWKKIGLE